MAERENFKLKRQRTLAITPSDLLFFINIFPTRKLVLWYKSLFLLFFFGFLNGFPLFSLYAVTIALNGREVTVTGPRGKLVRDFDHTQLTLKINKATRTVTVEKWHGKRKELSQIRTICSLINNMVKGVTKVCFSSALTQISPILFNHP